MYRPPPTAAEVMSMSAAQFRQACQDLAVREYARHHARIDELETRRALAKFGAPQPRHTESREAMIAKMTARGMSEADAAEIADAVIARR
jgi:hypothetical protein